VFAYDDLASVMPVMQTLSADGLAADVATTLAHVEERGFAPARCGVVGFCMGGTVAFLAATQHRLGAAVTFYGGGVSTGRFGLPPLVELAPALRTPWLGLYGDRDRGIPVEDVEALREATAAAPVETEIVRYPDAEHGFHCDDRPAVHAPDAAADAWARTLAWFELHLAGA
jgi:carboxymethylenebutenolidase